MIYPVHKNPNVFDVAYEMLKEHPCVHLINPVDVKDMHNLIGKFYMVLTDSGGLQEEAPSLCWCYARPEAVEAGVVKVVGIETQEIVEAVRLLLTDEREYQRMSKAINPYDDGNAGKRICHRYLNISIYRYLSPNPYLRLPDKQQKKTRGRFFLADFALCFYDFSVSLFRFPCLRYHVAPLIRQ